MNYTKILEWLAAQGVADLYTSDAVANPTSGPGAVLFSHTAGGQLILYRLTFLNDSDVPQNYRVETNDGGGWEVAEIECVPAHTAEQVVVFVAVPATESVRIGIVADENATGTSRVAVEYIDLG